MYHRGTIEEFNTWHDVAMASEGISASEGKIGRVNGNLAPDNQRTVAYSTAMQNPDLTNDYIWVYGDYVDAGKAGLTKVDAEAAGWFQSNEV